MKLRWLVLFIEVSVFDFLFGAVPWEHLSGFNTLICNGYKHLAMAYRKIRAVGWKIVNFDSRQGPSVLSFKLKLSTGRYFLVRSFLKPSKRTIQIYEPKFWSLLTTYGNFVVNLTTGQIQTSLQNPIYWLKVVLSRLFITYDS